MATAFAEPLVPGKEQLLVAEVRLPPQPGACRLQLALMQGKRVLARRAMALHVSRDVVKASPLGPLVEAARAALVEAKRLEALPSDYMDVTEGRLAGFKKQLKRKLLNNFRRAYVDVAFRQQSALNRKLIAVMSLLLDTAGTGEQTARLARLERELNRERRHRQALERRLATLEQMVPSPFRGEG
jgi:hypothetical protein